MELRGTAEAVRDIEETLELAQERQIAVIWRGIRKDAKIQGDKFESGTFSRTYEVCPSKKALNWEVSAGSFLELIGCPSIKVRFWYEYRQRDKRNRTGRVTVTEGSLNTLFKLIPGFAKAFQKIREENNKKGVGDDKVSKSTG